MSDSFHKTVIDRDPCRVSMGECERLPMTLVVTVVYYPSVFALLCSFEGSHDLDNGKGGMFLRRPPDKFGSIGKCREK